MKLSIFDTYGTTLQWCLCHLAGLYPLHKPVEHFLPEESKNLRFHTRGKSWGRVNYQEAQGKKPKQVGASQIGMVFMCGWCQGPGEGNPCLTITLESCSLRLVWYFRNIGNPFDSLCMCLLQECVKKTLKLAAQQGQKCSRANLTLEQPSWNKLICAEWKWKENIVLLEAFGRVFSYLFTHSCDLCS